MTTVRKTKTRGFLGEAILRRLALGPQTIEQLVSSLTISYEAAHKALTSLKKRGDVTCEMKDFAKNKQVKIYKIMEVPREHTAN